MATADEGITVDQALLTRLENDDAAEWESQFSTDSLTASIYEYRFENGRRYHAYKDGQYAIPNDEAEQDRLDIVHHVYLLLFKGELFMAPIGPNPQRILDVGTGTGIWAVDVAERYPSAEVIGTDLSPIQPSLYDKFSVFHPPAGDFVLSLPSVPPNVQFQIDDAKGEWTFGEGVFDLIHIRHLNIGIDDWGKLVKEAFRALKPGGWIDMAEFDFFLTSDDGSLKETSFLWKYYVLVNEAASRIGRDFTVAANMGTYLKEAGFVDIHHEPMKIPYGTWPADPRQKEMGAYLLLSAESGFEAFGYGLLTRVMGMSIEEVEELARLAKTDSMSRKLHSYSLQHIYWAQKPHVDKRRSTPG